MTRHRRFGAAGVVRLEHCADAVAVLYAPSLYLEPVGERWSDVDFCRWVSAQMCAAALPTCPAHVDRAECRLLPVA